MFTFAHDVASYIGAALNCKRGATAIEYGLIAAGIAVVIVVGINLVGTRLETLFNTTIAGNLPH